MHAMVHRSIFVLGPLLPLLVFAAGCSGAPSGETTASSGEALTEPASFLARGTGGAGLGAGLSAQGAIAREGRWLFAVNAGSNDVSTFDLASSPPELVAVT